MTRLSQVRQHSVKPYHKENEDNEDDENVRPPRRRKRRRIESEATETTTRKKVYTRSSTIAQPQTCTTRGITVCQSSPADAESILGRDYQEYLSGLSQVCEDRTRDDLQPRVQARRRRRDRKFQSSRGMGSSGVVTQHD